MVIMIKTDEVFESRMACLGKEPKVHAS